MRRTRPSHSDVPALRSAGVVIANAATAGLVATHRDWPGLVSSPRAYTAKPRIFKRPTKFFRDIEANPERESLPLTIPPAFRAEGAKAFSDFMVSAETQGIVKTFGVEKYGEKVLMAPKPEGFNIAGYVLPTLVVLMVAGIMVVLLRRRIRITAAATSAGMPAGAAAGTIAAPPASAEELARLERDNPPLAMAVHKLLARLLATKLRQTNTWLSHLR